MKEGYKKTSKGIIPNDWNIKNFNNCVKIQNGQVDPKIEPYCEMKHIGPGNIEKFTGKLLYVNTAKEDMQTSGKYLFDEEDILYGKINPQLGKVVFPQFCGICSADMYPLKANKEHMLPMYLKYSLLNNDFFKYSVSVSMRTGMPKINREELSEYSFIVPPLKEQEKIAEILSTVDCQIDDTEKLIEKCRVLKKGLMQRLLTKGIGHSEFKKTEVGEIPVGWEVKRFSEISKVNQGLQIAIEDRFKEGSENRLPYITIQYINDKNNKDNEFFIENANESVICTEDDILMTRTGNTGEVITNEHGVFHNNFFKIDYDRNFVVKDYLVYYLKSNEIQNLIRRYAGTTTIPDLKHSDFYRIPVVIPSIKEQEKIAGILLSVDNETEVYESEKQKLEELKKGLMQQLLTGKVRTI